MANDLITKSGIYTDKDGNRFVGRRGDAKPDGWTYAGPVDGEDDADPTAAPLDERAKPAAPENKAKASAPENRSA